tara:strand:- start:27585 stop:27752 length:168 start_codon:yes stop_codon:yes gene_type:complete
MTTEEAKNLVKWRRVSEIVTGNANYINNNVIPEKHRSEIERYIQHIESFTFKNQE